MLQCLKDIQFAHEDVSMIRLCKFFITLLCLQGLFFVPCSFAAMREIDEASAAAREVLEQARAADMHNPSSKSSAAPLTLSNAEIVRLETALERGEQINTSLRTQIEALEAERAKLVQIQAVLTSGLVGALVTAIVAIAGAFVTSRNSRPDRDLKRLNVLEKVQELQQAGIPLPSDITKNYVAAKHKPID